MLLNRSHNILMLALALAVAMSAAVSPKEDCNCWEDFKVETDESGESYCRSTKLGRIFGCNEDKPPICECEENGKRIKLDLGHTDCLSVDLQGGRWCKNRDEFEKYFKKYPIYAIQD